MAPHRSASLFQRFGRQFFDLVEEGLSEPLGWCVTDDRDSVERPSWLERVGRFVVEARPVPRLPVWQRYLLTTLLVLAALGLRILLADVLDPYPFILFFPAVIVAAFVFNKGTGIYAAFLSAALALYFFVEPRDSFTVENAGAAIAVGLFLLISLFTAALIEALRTTVGRLTAALDQVRTLQEQKTILLQETNHRIKNNLHTMASLLTLQSQAIAAEPAREALKAAAGRLAVIGRLHNQLAYKEDSTLVDARAFILDLCEDLRLSLVHARRISIEVAVQSVNLSLQRAIAAGLIVNELVTNALKYAFPDDRAGAVRVNLDRVDGNLALTVADNGVGIATDSRMGTGTRIVSALTRQLAGRLEQVPVPQGTTFRVIFPAAEPT